MHGMHSSGMVSAVDFFIRLSYENRSSCVADLDYQSVCPKPRCCDPIATRPRPIGDSPREPATRPRPIGDTLRRARDGRRPIRDPSATSCDGLATHPTDLRRLPRNWPDGGVGLLARTFGRVRAPPQLVRARPKTIKVLVRSMTMID